MICMLPKFLWRHIIDKLTTSDISNMIVAIKSFNVMLDDDSWKRCFLDGRRSAIAVVQCNTKIDYCYWKYACYNHVTCDSFDDIFCKINNSTYYNIYIKAGEYKVDPNNYFYYNSNHCHINLIGTKDKTIVSYNDIDSKIYQIKLGSLSIHDISLINIELRIANANNLHINNCEFDRSCISICTVNKVIIEQCMFNGVSPIYIELYEARLPQCEYIIKNNTFSREVLPGDRACILFHGKHLACNITIANNIISYYRILCQVGEYDTIIFRDNCISDVVSCVNCWWGNNKSVILFENNTFDQVDRLYGAEITGNIRLSGNNMFINCEEELTKYVSI